MSLRVLKFGGSSVETPARILGVARRILALHQDGDPVLIVVSAMGETTDALLRLAAQVSRTPSRRELDMLLTSGERVSMSLLAMALQSLGESAISFTGSQSGIVTDRRHADARIVSIRPLRIAEELERGRIVIVAGFQGVSEAKEVTTLGRGGSDTTAVALAIRFGAERCEIFTDVPGILSADPRLVPTARPIPEFGYGPMIALSHFGGRVLFHRAVVLARRFGMPLQVRSATGDETGTRIPGRPPADSGSSDREETEPMESDQIVAVALESPVVHLRLALPAAGASAFTAFDPAEAPEPICQASYVAPDGAIQLDWIGRANEETAAWLERTPWPREAEPAVDRESGLITLIGEGSTVGPTAVARALSILDSAGIEPQGFQAGAHSFSLLLPLDRAEEAVRRLHDGLIGAG